jgi:uncharacterized membrane protein
MADETATPNTNPEIKEAVASIPPSWPGGFGLYKYSRDAVKYNFWVLAGIWLLSAVVNSVLRSLLKDTGDLIGFIFSAFFTVAFTSVYIASVRRKKVEFGDELSKSLSYWLKMIGLMILISLALVGSFILLIIPFFFVLPRIVLATYYLVDQNLGPVEAFQASWNATNGYALKIWGVIGAAVAMGVLVVTIIGIPFAIYFLVMYSAVYAVVYEFISKTQPKVVAAPEAATPIAPTV